MSLQPSEQSTIANIEGRHLVIGIKDKTLEFVVTDISRLSFNGQLVNPQSVTFKLTEQCTYLPSEGLSIEKFVTDNTQKRVWIIHISGIFLIALYWLKRKLGE